MKEWVQGLEIKSVPLGDSPVRTLVCSLDLRLFIEKKEFFDLVTVSTFNTTYLQLANSVISTYLPLVSTFNTSISVRCNITTVKPLV